MATTTNPLLDKIHEMMEHPLPTPPVGSRVCWFEANETDRIYAATVTKIEGPGKLKLCVQKPDHMPMHKTGVLHRSHPCHINKHSTETMRCGAWDYVEGDRPLKFHYERHLQELRRREAGILEQEKINAEIAATGHSERAVT